MMETYAERLKREGRHQMTNYDMDEMRRQEQAKVERKLSNADYDGMLGQTDTVSPEWNARRSDEDMTEKRKQFAQDLIDSEKTTNVELEISDHGLLHLANAAHDRNMTLNQLCINVLTSAFDDLDYRFEHSSKTVVLKEY